MFRKNYSVKAVCDAVLRRICHFLSQESSNFCRYSY